jgi:hypothetical protein
VGVGITLDCGDLILEGIPLMFRGHTEILSGWN